jgi:hypothetical protein
MISEEEIEYFTNLDLMNHIFQNGYACKDYGRALGHVCYGNEKLSKKVCKFLLHGVTRNNDYNFIKNFLDGLEPFIVDNAETDDLMRKKMEWLFGFGLLDEVDTTDGRTVLGLDLTFN